MEVWPVEAGSMAGWGGLGSGVHTLRRTGGGTPVPLCLQHVCRVFVAPFWQGRQLDVWLWRSIAGCLCISAFTVLCPRNSSPRFCSSRTWLRGFSMSYVVSSIAARQMPSLAILAIFNARRMSDCSSCTRPPCSAIVADMFKTYKKSVDASNNQIRLLPLPYTLLQPPLRWLKPVLSTHRDAYREIHLQKYQCSQHDDVRFRPLCGQMPWLTMDASSYGQQWIRYVALYGDLLYVILSIDCCLSRYGYTHIQLHAASCFRRFQSCGWVSNLHPGSYVWWLYWQHRREITCVCALVTCQEFPYLM